MRILHQIVALWRSLFRSARIDADLADEMRFHIERETEANIARGMSPEAAHRAARLKFGSVEVAQETSRDERPGVGARRMLQDVRFGVRLLRKSPAFGITAIAIVALGIGAATAIFSVVYGVMLKPLPFREPERLVGIWLQWKVGRGLSRRRRRRRAASSCAASSRTSHCSRTRTSISSATGSLSDSRVRASHRISSRCSASRAALGRTFAPDEDQAGRERVVLLSDALWHGRFAADRAVIGRQIRLNGSPHTIVGVMPPDFQYPSSAHQAWVPLVLEPGELTRAVTDNYSVVARLDARATLDQARREAAALARRLATTAPGGQGPGMTVDPMLDDCGA